MRHQIVPWFGSKAALAPQIVPELGPHKTYFEPFAGGLGMLLRKPSAPRETVNDLHLDITNLARVLADAKDSGRLRKQIAARLCCETLNREARARLKKPFVAGVDRAADFFYVAWMGVNGVVGADACNAMAHGYTAASHTCANKLRQAAASIDAFHQRMADVTITNRDAFKLLAKIQDAPGILIYCDPPYVVKDGTYYHDFAAADHARLAQSLLRFRQTRVVVSYTAHPVLDQLYTGWSQKTLDYQPRANRRAKVKRPKPSEILLINGPLLAA